MKIGSIGYNHSHNKEFVMDISEGLDACWLFLIIKTPAVFEIAGQRMEVAKDSILLLEENTVCRYRAKEEIYTDDWFYAKVEPGDRDMLSELAIPVNEPVYLGKVKELSQLIHIMSYEHYSADAYHQEIEALYLEILFKKISRLIQSKVYVSPDVFLERNTKLTRLRSSIYTLPDQVKDIDTMAKEMGISRSGLQHLYKKNFGVSIMNDVIHSRTEYAKRLLATTNMTLQEIAEQTGYSSAYHFMRQFKQVCGMTPTQYRSSTERRESEG